MISLDEALAKIAAVVSPVDGSEQRALVDAINAVAAQDVHAPYALPPFNNSAVDGYAFRHNDLKKNQLLQLTIQGESMAGQPYVGRPLSPGGAIRIATGGMLPPGCDVIAMQEICQIEVDRLTINELPAPEASVRRAGNDIAQGAVAIKKGLRLRPQDVAFLHALGLTQITTYRKLRIGIVSTGHELRAAGSRLDTGQIVDTNGLMLKQLMQNRDAVVTLLPSLPDTYEATADFLNIAAASYDIIVSSGGVSVGGRDFISDVMHKTGKVHFWKIAIKPGRPVLFGQIGNCLMAGLPGNPVSAMVTFFLIVCPLLDALVGIAPALTPFYYVPLASAIEKESHLRVFPRVALRQNEGHWMALPYRDQSSNLLSSLVTTDGLLDLPLGSNYFEAGTLVAFRPFQGLL